MCEGNRMPGLLVQKFVHAAVRRHMPPPPSVSKPSRLVPKFVHAAVRRHMPPPPSVSKPGHLVPKFVHAAPRRLSPPPPSVSKPGLLVQKFVRAIITICNIHCKHGIYTLHPHPTKTRMLPTAHADLFSELVHVSTLEHRQDATDCAVDNDAPLVMRYIQEHYGGWNKFLSGPSQDAAQESCNGFTRIERLRRGLVALDRGGWERSYHQRLFHESFLNAVVRILFKTDPPGFFSQSYPRLLEMNAWSSINQEILVSTPRRFGKTISVCLFVAALLYACPSLEISIYSTCKRISQKLLRNCIRFLEIIHDVLREDMPKFIKQTTDEIEIQGTENKYDFRRLNSYPSKVFASKSLHFIGYACTILKSLLVFCTCCLEKKVLIACAVNLGINHPKKSLLLFSRMSRWHTYATLI